MFIVLSKSIKNKQTNKQTNKNLVGLALRAHTGQQLVTHNHQSQIQTDIITSPAMNPFIVTGD